ncbi:hypothetical protein MMC25_004376 [Agyrium rufum]|nr:hypothetical protein [Agyrium rufum]
MSQKRKLATSTDDSEPSTRRSKRARKSTVYTDSQSTVNTVQSLPDSSKVAEPESTKLSEDFWLIKDIIRERGRGKSKQYLVDWEPDSKTGEIWKPEWTPASNVTDSAIEEWNLKKGQKKKKKPAVTSKYPTLRLRGPALTASPFTSSPPSVGPSKSARKAVTSRRPKNRKFVNSSPDPGAKDQDSEALPTLPVTVRPLKVQVPDLGSQYPSRVWTYSSQQNQPTSSPLSSTIKISLPPTSLAKLSSEPIVYSIQSQEAKPAFEYVPDSQSQASKGNGVSAQSSKSHPGSTSAVAHSSGSTTSASSKHSSENNSSDTEDLARKYPIDGQSSQDSVSYKNHQISRQSASSQIESPRFQLNTQGSGYPVLRSPSNLRLHDQVTPSQSNSVSRIPDSVLPQLHTEGPSTKSQGTNRPATQSQAADLSNQRFQTQLPLHPIESISTEAGLSSQFSSQYGDRAQQQQVDHHISEESAISSQISAQLTLDPIQETQFNPTTSGSEPRLLFGQDPIDITHDTSSGQVGYRSSYENPPYQSQSSPFRTPPAARSLQLPDTKHPYTPSRNPIMADQGPVAVQSPAGYTSSGPPDKTPTPSFREKLRSMRAKSEAESRAWKAAQEQSSVPHRAERSPSTVPQQDIPIPVGNSRLQVQTLDDQVTPVLPQNVAPYVETISDPLPPREITRDEIVKCLTLPPRLGRSEFVVPLPAPARIQNAYIEIINENIDLINTLIEGTDVHPRAYEQTQELLLRLDLLTSHSDFDDATTENEAGVSSYDAATWARSDSFKFAFLDSLFNDLRSSSKEMHIVLVTRPGRMLDILEKFLRGVHVQYERSDTLSFSNRREGNIRITLIPSIAADASVVVGVADLVIAFDHTFDSTTAQVEEARRHMVDVEQLAPVIHLIIYSSPEHIERCLPDELLGQDRIRVLISCVAHTTAEFGSLYAEDMEVPDAAKEVAAFVQNDTGKTENTWTLLDIRPIKIENITIELSQTSTDANMEPEIEEAPGLKRRLESELNNEESSKRQRMTPAGETENVIHDVVEGAERQTDITTRNKVSRRSIQRELENVLSRNESLVSHNAKLEQRLEQITADLDGLQGRLESVTVGYNTLRHEKKESAELADRLALKHTKTLADLEVSKEARKMLESELAAARAALVSSDIPQISELETLRGTSRDIEAKNASLEKQLKNVQTAFDYTREQYQRVSSTAAEAMSRVSELETELATANKQASDQGMRLRQMNQNAEIEIHKKRIEELECMLEDREDMLKRKGEGRGRAGMQTRAGSVQPRSPRLGGIGTTGSLRGSRQASPLPGGHLGANLLDGMSGITSGNLGSAMREGLGRRVERISGLRHG